MYFLSFFAFFVHDTTMGAEKVARSATGASLELFTQWKKAL